jgi:polyphosphate kinase
MYEDMGLLTSNPIITDDVARLFNHLSGMTQETNYRRLLVAPHGIRRGLLDRIEGEIANHEAGLPSGVKIKVNSVVDEALIDALYRASQAGVPVDMLVRGICTIRPGVPGLSENVRVRSILGRFLEHSRVFWFAGGGRPTVGIGSSDLMHRNLDRRVEAIVSLNHPDHIRQVEDLFEQAFSPEVVHWELTDSEWTTHTTDEEGTPLTDLQESLIQQAKARRATR